MIKGTVISTDRTHAYIYTSDCQMVRRRLQPDMNVGEEIIMETDRESNKQFGLSRTFKYALIAVSVLLVISLGVFIGQSVTKNQVYAKLSIDVNPSLELSLNRDLDVVTAKAMNSEAEALLEGQKLEGLNWKDAVMLWTTVLKNNQYDVKTVLLSAVIPAGESDFTAALTSMEGSQGEDALHGVAVRVLYSNDENVVKDAKKNTLSIGRQMLLDQSRYQNQNWDEESIADAPLGDLVQQLLQNQEQNQTGMKNKLNPSASDPSEVPGGSALTEQNKETNKASNGDAQGSESHQTNQEANKETNQESNRETIQETNRETNQEASGETNQETNQEMNGSTQNVQSQSASRP